MNHQDMIARQLQALFPMGVSGYSFHGQPPIAPFAQAAANTTNTFPQEDHQYRQQTEALFASLSGDQQRSEAVRLIRDVRRSTSKAISMQIILTNNFLPFFLAGDTTRS